MLGGVPDWPRDPTGKPLPFPHKKDEDGNDTDEIDWRQACNLYGKIQPWSCDKADDEDKKNEEDN